MATAPLKDLKPALAALDAGARDALQRRAARLRDEARRQARPSKGGARRGSGRNSDLPWWALRLKDASLEDWMLRLLADDLAAQISAPEAEEDVHAPEESSRVGLVVWAGRKVARVLEGEQEIDATLAGALQRTARSTLAVGDAVLLAGDADEARILRVLPRRTVLSRPDPHAAAIERVIAANVDLVVIVASAAAPVFRPGLVDRYLVAVERGGAEALLVLNKVDLIGSAEEARALEEALAPYRALALGVLRCSAESGAGLDPLRSALAGKTAALVGHSGVGKSSLLNALAPGLALRTGAVSDFHGKGRHTTTSSALLCLPGGARIIDTPGVRALGLGRLEPGELRWYFPEFESVARDCQYRDCTHVHEPDCAVKGAVAAGSIAQRRLDSYHRIMASLAEESA